MSFRRPIRLLALFGTAALLLAGCATSPGGQAGANLNPNMLTGPTISPLLTGLSADQLAKYIAWFRDPSTTASATADASPLAPGPDGQIQGTFETTGVRPRFLDVVISRGIELPSGLMFSAGRKSV